jgi:hypothetical protein
MNDKSVIKKIIGLEDWSEFEEFIQLLYKKNEQAIEVIRNYKTTAKSGRVREVDVLVKLGINPHIISLGIECKYWNKKVDGDILDVVKNKKDDLGIDKFVVITTIGYERGAELYAKEFGIDVFIIRPIYDDDFGYTGKCINFRFLGYGSTFTDIRIGAELVSEISTTDENKKYVVDKLSKIEIKNFDDFDHDYDLYNYNTDFINGIMTYQKLEFKKNLLQIILDTWKEYNELYYKKLECCANIKLDFKSNYAFFFHDKKIIVILKELLYHIRFFVQEWDFTIDRSENHPAVLENVIDRAITPLKKVIVNNKSSYEMDETIKVEPIDIAKKPPDVISRGGVDTKYLLSKPMMGPFKNEEHNKTYELIYRDGKSIYEIVEK